MYKQKPFDPGNGNMVEPGFTTRPGSTMGIRVDGEDQPDFYKKQGQLGEFRGQSIEDMRAGGAFDYTNEGYVGSYAMDQMSDRGTVRIQRGQFMSTVDVNSREGKDYLRQTYSDRFEGNRKAKLAAVEAEQVGYDYTDPHTGEIFKAKSGYEAPQSDMPAVDVTPQMQAQRDSIGVEQPRYIRRSAEQRRLDQGRRIKGSELTNRQRIRLSKGGDKAARQRNRLQRQADRRQARARRQEERQRRRRLR